MKVRVTPGAEQEIIAAAAYLQAQSPAAAQTFKARLREALERLQHYPESGRRIPEFPELRYREVVIAPYRLFYRVDTPASLVWIVALWHGAQLPSPPST